MPAFSFAKAVLTWFDRAGRQNLPWQQDITPYRVWVSEIMLQQTQVSTVIPYYQRFMRTFPTVEALAAAPLDQVLSLWTGLGYYARARNLHRAAQQVSRDLDGELPADLDALVALPGIGRSTAGAILAIAYQQRAVILDGNVKRVLARFHAIEGWPGENATSALLWQQAEKHTPANRTAAYTQAIMDLGALVCTRSQPLCSACPLQRHCRAFQQGQTSRYPTPRPRKTLPVREVAMLMIRSPGGKILLQQRPTQGLWGGLWSFPEVSPTENPAIACQAICGQNPGNIEPWPSWRHTFTHFHLDITPVLLDLPKTSRAKQGYRWVTASTRDQDIGLSKPACQLLGKLAQC